eukprot:7435837-Pyramimonas_sp.AAC.1
MARAPKTASPREKHRRHHDEQHGRPHDEKHLRRQDYRTSASTEMSTINRPHHGPDARIVVQ